MMGSTIFLTFLSYAGALYLYRPLLLSGRCFRVENMAMMFSFASSFDQNLCEWGPKLQQSNNEIVTQCMFCGGICPEPSDPDVALGGPYCYQCLFEGE